MQIVAFNSSPRDNETSKTEMVLKHFLEGTRRAGAATETLYLRNYKIHHCLGCFGCWFKSPGRCVQKDDMTEILFDRFLKADLAVLATPLYHYNMNARLKAFIERTLPMVQPFFVDKGEHTEHPERFEKIPRVVAVSVCGFPEQLHFQALSLNLRMIFGSRLVAEVYRHSAWALEVPALAAQANQVLTAVAMAGAEVVRDGKVNQATLAALAQDLAPREVLLTLINDHFQQELQRIAPQ